MKGFNKVVFPALVLSVFLIGLGLRIVPYLDWSIPLGYDAGFYRYGFQTYWSSLPRVAEGGLPAWFRRMHPSGLFLLMDAIRAVTGVSVDTVLRWMFAFFSAFVVFPVYSASKLFFGKEAGLFSSVIYVLSFTQFHAFEMMYYKNVLALILLLLVVYTVWRGSYVAFALLLAGVAAFHRPELLLLALSVGAYFVLSSLGGAELGLSSRQRGVLISSIAATLLVLPLWLPRIELYIDVLMSVFSSTSNTIMTGEAGAGGTFFGISQYLEIAGGYLPFAILGLAIHLRCSFGKREGIDLLAILTLVTAVIVFGRLFFWKRFIVDFDILFIVFAGYGAMAVIKNYRKEVGVVILGLAVLAVGIPTLNASVKAKPLINQEELETVEWIGENTPSEAVVFGTSYDAPWVIGWSNRTALAPGLFGYNRKGEEEWKRFLSSENPEFAYEFLKPYGNVIYVYHSGHDLLNRDKFRESYFKRVKSGDATVYKMEVER